MPGKSKRTIPCNARSVKAAAARRGRRTELRIEGCPGLVVDALGNGEGTFRCVYHRQIGGRRISRKIKLGGVATTDLHEARSKAREIMKAVEEGRDPAADKQLAMASTVDALLDEHLKRHIRPNLRSAAEIERVFKVYVRPRIGAKSIYELRRRDIVEMLDAIEDEHGPVMADRTLAHVRKAFNWHAARDDQFNSPIVKGMARTSPSERARKRMLSDEELCDIWQALDTADVPNCFPSYVRALLLTAQRRSEVSHMSWDAIADDVWIITADRHKTGNKAGDKTVPLTPAVMQLLGKQRSNGFVFSTTGGGEPFSGFNKAKRALDARIAELRKVDGRTPMPHWVLHDLRRTARSLMSRAGVSSDIAERVVGHVIPGVRGVYDRHAYSVEKRDALERLAALIDRTIIVRASPQSLAQARAAVGEGSEAARKGDSRPAAR